MALSGDALTTLQALKAYLSINGSESDGLLESLIEAVSSQFNSHTGRNLAARDYSWDDNDADYDPDNAVLDGSGHPELILPQYPLASISELNLDGAALTLASPGGSSGYLVDRAAGVLSRLDGVFHRGRGNVTLIYRSGFASIPADLSQAALEQSAERFQQSAAGHGRLGITARTLADGSVSYSASALLPQVRAVLDRYRNRSPL